MSWSCGSRYRDVVGYPRIGGSCLLHLQDTVLIIGFVYIAHLFPSVCIFLFFLYLSLFLFLPSFLPDVSFSVLTVLLLYCFITFWSREFRVHRNTLEPLLQECLSISFLDAKCFLARGLIARRRLGLEPPAIRTRNTSRCIQQESVRPSTSLILFPVRLTVRSRDRDSVSFFHQDESSLLRIRYLCPTFSFLSTGINYWNGGPSWTSFYNAQAHPLN